MNRSLKIAIYTGEVPSTTFIERLIKGLSKTNNFILLFGISKMKVRYNSNRIQQITFKDTKFHKFFFLLYYTVVLYLFRTKQKEKLDLYILSKKGNNLRDKIKFYPVLWHKPDVFHIQWAKSLEDWIWVQEFGIKIVVSLRGSHINYSPITERGLAEKYREFFPRVDGFHAVSKAIAVEAEKYGALGERIKVVYSGLNRESFSSSQMSNDENKKLHLLSVGRAHWVKGYNYALDACALLKNNGVDFHYTIIGAKGIEELEYQKNDLNLSDSITFLSHVPNDEVIKMMQQSSIIVLPSVEEGIANVILEAMMLEKLVLTTNCGGMEEIVEDGINGFVVPIRDPEAMSQKIIEISKFTDNQINVIEKKARKTIERLNSEEKMLAGINDLYASVLNEISI